MNRRGRHSLDIIIGSVDSRLVRPIGNMWLCAPVILVARRGHHRGSWVPSVAIMIHHLLGSQLVELILCTHMDRPLAGFKKEPVNKSLMRMWRNKSP